MQALNKMLEQPKSEGASEEVKSIEKKDVAPPQAEAFNKSLEKPKLVAQEMHATADQSGGGRSWTLTK